MQRVQPDTKTWREKIDEIDDELVILLNRRAELVLKLGKLKKLAHIPLYDSNRERQIVERARLLNTGPFDQLAITKIFRCIMKESRRTVTRSSSA
jgi:chorismate mutase